MEFKARLVRICGDSTRLGVHQLPISVEDMRTMVVEFSDACEGCSGQATMGPGGSTFRQFCQKLNSLGTRDAEQALTVGVDQFTSQLAQLVPCVGCRRGSKVRSLLENLTKCRKNKRCALHSLDSHLCKTKTTWKELWALMSKDCREECCIIECDSLYEMLETYLQKHRFCSECKHKVTRAYQLVIGEPRTDSDKHYKPALYQDIRHCYADGHVHVKACPDYIQGLIDRAEPELFGNIRERHAKTLDIAQGEVLICLGLYMYDRLHRIVSAVRALQQTYQLLYSTAVIALHNNFQKCYERKFGLGESVEQLCAELQMATPDNQNKKKKTAANVKRKAGKALLPKTSQGGCGCASLDRCSGSECDLRRRKSVECLPTNTSASSSPLPSTCSNGKPCDKCPSCTIITGDTSITTGGKLSKTRKFSQSASPPRRSAEIAVPKSSAMKMGGTTTNGSKNGIGTDPGAGANGLPDYDADHSDQDQGYASLELSPCARKYNAGGECKRSNCSCGGEQRLQASKLLQRVQDANSGIVNGRVSEDDESSTEGCTISPEEIDWFEKNRSRVDRERSALRQRLQDEFVNMQARLAAKLPPLA